jgi:threonyl-tRNA synthetase
VTIDHEGCITEFNPAAERTFGYRRDDVLGKEMADVIIPVSLREKHRQGLRAQQRALEGQSFELESRAEQEEMEAEATGRAVRLAEFGTMWRYEKSGELSGLSRVRRMDLNDAHIFCMSSQIEAEVEACVDFAYAVMKNFGFDKFEVELSDWDAKHPENYAGKPEDWARATAALANTMDRLKIPYKKLEGEGAFYGPKIDIKLIDAIGRSWQLTTVQFDFNLPARFGLEYVGDDGARHQPLMVHRALLGSVERFFGILIEHYAGAFPLWLAPVQVEICPVSEKAMDYAKHVHETLKNHGIRVHLDDRNEKLPAKIRDAQLQKIPYMLVVGPKEAEAGTVSVRHRSKGDLGPKALTELVEALHKEADDRAI